MENIEELREEMRQIAKEEVIKTLVLLAEERDVRMAEFKKESHSRILDRWRTTLIECPEFKNSPRDVAMLKEFYPGYIEELSDLLQ
jgi:hypothetical protein